MGIISSRKRRYSQHSEFMENQDLNYLERIKQKVIKKPRIELILYLTVVLDQALQENKTGLISSLSDPIFIRDIIFKSKLKRVESFSDFLDKIVDGEPNMRLKDLVERVLFLHQTPLPDDGYERLHELGLSDTSIYLLNNYTHSVLQVSENNLNIPKIIDVLSRQQFMDEVQDGRFRAFVAKHGEKIRSELTSILEERSLSPVQLSRIIERLDFVDQNTVKQIAQYFNKWLEKYRRQILGSNSSLVEFYYDPRRNPSEYAKSFITSPISEQWIESFRLFMEGENKTVFENELLSTSIPEYRPIIDNVLYRLNN
jgi:hypothetical protein